MSENRTALFNILSTTLIAGVNFFTITNFTRMLDTDGDGIVSIYTAWVQILGGVVGLKIDGTIGSAQVNLPERDQDRYQVSILLFSLLVFGVASALFCVCLDSLSQWLLLGKEVVLALLFQSYGTFVIGFFAMRFIFRKEAIKNFILSVGVCLATTLLSVALIFLVFTSSDAYLGRVFGLAFPNFSIGVLLLLWLVLRTRSWPRASDLLFCLPLAIPLVFHGLSQLVLSQTGKIFVQQSMGDSAAGVFGLAITIVTLLTSICSALNNAFVPFMYEDLAGKTSKTVKRSHFINYVVLVTLGTCAFCLLSPEVLKLMSTPSYWSATSLLPPLVVGQYCVFLYSFPVNYEFFKMKTGSIAIGTLLAATLNIALTLALIPLFGIMGAAMAAAIAYLVLFLFHFCMARFRLGDQNYPVRFLFGGLGVVILSACCCCAAMGAPHIRWIVGLLLFGAAFFRIYKMKTIF